MLILFAHLLIKKCWRVVERRIRYMYTNLDYTHCVVGLKSKEKKLCCNDKLTRLSPVFVHRNLKYVCFVNTNGAVNVIEKGIQKQIMFWYFFFKNLNKNELRLTIKECMYMLIYVNLVFPSLAQLAQLARCNLNMIFYITLIII